MWTRLGELVVVVALFGLAACGATGGGDAGDDDATMGDLDEGDLGEGVDVTDDSYDDDAADDTTPDATDDTAEFSTCAYNGRVLDQAGAPIEKVSIVVCGEDAALCVKATSKPDGAWSVSGTARKTLGAKVLGGPSGHTSVSLPLAPCATPTTDLGDVVLFQPEPGDAYDGVTGDWLQVHPALALQIPPGTQTQMYETEFTAQAALVDLERLHPLLAAQLTPVAAFALVPYYAEPPAPVPFRATLPVASAAVGVYVLDYLTGQFQLVEDVAVGADGVATSSAGGGLPQLTWVAFVER